MLRRRLSEPPYEPEVVAAIKHNVRRGAVCVDVGAYAGVITRVLARAAGREGRVVAFEAFPENAEALRLAIKKLDKAGTKGVIHANQAANRKSRLMRRVAQITADSE